MKTIIFTTMAILLFLACDKDSHDPVQATLALGDSTKIIGKYSLTVDSIQDSRCPLAVDCVWAGIVTAFFTVEVPGQGQQVIQVCNGIADSCFALSTQDEFFVRLDSITPYPISVIKQSDYRVHLTTGLAED